MDQHTREHLHESPSVVTVPLILLAIPSLVIGAIAIEPMLFGDYFGSSIVIDEAHGALAHVEEEFHGVGSFLLHGLMGPAFWLAMLGLASAWYIYMKNPAIADQASKSMAPLYNLLVRKYGFDEFNEKFFAFGTRRIGRSFWKGGDQLAIDGIMVNGTARTIGWIAGVLRHIQTGYLYHYAFAMIIGLLGLLTFFVIL
jgi:NADH-quinone oxidoreductase subunit L